MVLVFDFGNEGNRDNTNRFILNKKQTNQFLTEICNEEKIGCVVPDSIFKYLKLWIIVTKEHIVRWMRVFD